MNPLFDNNDNALIILTRLLLLSILTRISTLISIAVVVVATITTITTVHIAALTTTTNPVATAPPLPLFLLLFDYHKRPLIYHRCLNQLLQLPPIALRLLQITL